MRRHILATAALFAAVASCGSGSTAAIAPLGVDMSLTAPSTTLAVVSGYVEGFAQDGNHLLWATESGRCGRNVVLRTLSTGRSRFLDGVKGPMCDLTQYAGEVQPWMGLAGTRAVWAYLNTSLSHYNYTVFAAAPGESVERQVAEMSIEGGLSDDGSELRPVPIAGHAQTLVFADINTDEGEPSGVYRIVAQRAQQVAGTRDAFAVAVAGSRFALARSTPAGCVCNTMPAWSPDGRRIAFVSVGTGLFVMNGDGTGLRRVIDDAKYFAWAPDGASFAVSQDDGLMIVAAQGGRVRKIGPRSSDPVRGTSGAPPFAWSPDGTQLAYAADARGHVLVVPAAGGVAVDLGEASGETPQWSSDSRRIAYARHVGQQDHVFVAAPGARTSVDLGPGVASAWAPDGSAIAVLREDGVYVSAPDGSGIRRIASGSFSSVEWSPNGKWIAFGGSDDGLWVAQPDGGAPRKLAQNSSEIHWSPDSRAIADTGDVVEVDSGAQHALPRDLLCDPPRWSPDSTRLVCVVPNTPDFYLEGEVAVVDARAEKITTLTQTQPAPARTIVETRTAAGKLQSKFDAPQRLSGLAWGGSMFALLIARSKTQATIEIRSARGHLLRRVSVPRPGFDQLSMSGRWVVFQAGKTIRAVDATTGRTTVLAQTKKASIVGLSIDGRRVAWAESTSKRGRIRAMVLPVR
jgi:Tol biopolymer transport system component